VRGGVGAGCPHCGPQTDLCVWLVAAALRPEPRSACAYWPKDPSGEQVTAGGGADFWVEKSSWPPVSQHGLFSDVCGSVYSCFTSLR
jgi:hypothetical protein